MGDRSIEQFVHDCNRADWMLWLASQVGVDKRLIALTTGHITNTVRHLMIDERSTTGVDAIIAYGEGKISIDELKVAAEAAGEAWMAAGEAEATWLAAEAVWWAAAATWYAVEVALAAGADPTTLTNIVRQYMGEQLIIQTNKLLNQ